MDSSVRDATAHRLEMAVSTLSTAARTHMEERLPWFRTMSAENRSWIGLVAQAGIAAFVEWFRHPDKHHQLTSDVFGTAPRDLTRAVTLQQTVEMVRVAIDVVEARVEDLAAPGGVAELREAVLWYTREIAFAAAQVYARAAEARGAWDARLEALVVDALLRGEVDEGLHSWAAALGWDSSAVVVVAGYSPDEEPEAVIDEVRRVARRARVDALVGVQGRRLVIVVSGTAETAETIQPLVGCFGSGPVVVGPPAPDLHAATASAQAALAGLRAARAWSGAPRPVGADELLPERALDGDVEARAYLANSVYGALAEAGPSLLETLTTYLEQGTSLEATARLLFVHSNTVRYRLRRVTEVTGYVPTSGREAFVLQVALALGRLGQA